MKEVPSKLQCAYCIRHRYHGGECQNEKSHYDNAGCLFFKLDERGCIRNKDFKLPIKLYEEIPMLNEWCDKYELNGVETEIKVMRIYRLSWDTQRGVLIIHCNCDYFINEYHENYIEHREKPKLKIVK